MKSLFLEFEQQALDPPMGDERIAAFSQAVLESRHNPQIEKSVDILNSRKFETASYAANLMLRAVQKQLIKSDKEYPGEYDESHHWKRALTKIFTDPEQSFELHQDLSTKTTQSNIVERYKAFKLAIELLRPQESAGISILDIGCSRNHGLKKLHLNLPFKPIELGLSDQEGRVSNTIVNRLGNIAINSPRIYAKSIGVDSLPITSDASVEWARSCSFYPSELLDMKSVAEYDLLDKVEPESVTFQQADMFDRKIVGIGLHNIITASTFFYQLPLDKRAIVRHSLRNRLAEGGMIIYQDFMKRDRTAQNLTYEDSWTANLYPYRTFVELPSVNDNRIYEIFRWSNGRCKIWAPGRDLDELIKSQDIA